MMSSARDIICGRSGASLVQGDELGEDVDGLEGIIRVLFHVSHEQSQVWYTFDTTKEALLLIDIIDALPGRNVAHKGIFARSRTRPASSGNHRGFCQVKSTCNAALNDWSVSCARIGCVLPAFVSSQCFVVYSLPHLEFFETRKTSFGKNVLYSSYRTKVRAIIDGALDIHRLIILSQIN